MATVLCVIVHPSRLVREGLKAILANTSLDPVCTTSSTEEVPSTIAAAGEQVLVLIGARQAANLAEDIRAAKASIPDAAIVVIGDASNRDVVISALNLGAATFIDEGVATSTLIKELELVAQGEPVISLSLIKPLLARRSGPASEQAVAPIIALDRRQPAEPEDDAKPHLSGREAAILTALAQGTPNRIIASQLCIRLRKEAVPSTEAPFLTHGAPFAHSGPELDPQALPGSRQPFLLFDEASDYFLRGAAHHFLFGI
jgi:DNA-binding NarL/FixJ family response regulator